ncbi:MAG: putative membrane protein [Candidatus Omnitrophota bacterium]|jgi:uncharacterized membrane protein
MDDYQREISRATVWVSRAALAFGCLLSVYLTVATLNKGVVYGCVGEPSCYLTLRTPWGRWFGLPIALPGAVVFGVLFFLSFWIKPYTTEITSLAARKWFVFLAALTGFVGVWMMAVQLGLLRTICPFCAIANGCGILVVVLYISWFPRDLPSTLKGLLVTLLVVAGQYVVPAGTPAMKSGPAITPKASAASDVKPEDEFAGTLFSLEAPPDPVVRKNFDDRELVFNTAGLTTTNAHVFGRHEKVILPPAPVLTPPQVFEEETLISGSMGTRVQRTHYDLAAGKIHLKVGDVPILGPSNATHVVGLMYDYTYTNSVMMHHMMDLAVDRYDGQLAVVLLPVPLDKDCNDWLLYTKDPHTNSCEYTEMSMLIWRQKPELFHEFEAYITRSIPPPPLHQVDAVVRKLVGETVYNHPFSRDDAYRTLRQNVLLYRKLDLGPLPKLISQKRVALGMTPIAEDLFNYLENLLLLEPPGALPE